MDNKFTVLIIEDDRVVRNYISTFLITNGYNVIHAKNGQEGISLSTSRCPDIILLDLGLPDFDGNEVIKSIRIWMDTPIIVISARGEEKSKIEAIDLGADDYVTKPFGTGELLARMRAALRHSIQKKTPSEDNCEKVTINQFMIDFEKRKVIVDNEVIHFTPIEYRIVELLARHVGKVLTHDYITKEIWGPYINDKHILRVNMANIRRKIEKNPANPIYIITEVGVGYRLNEGDF